MKGLYLTFQSESEINKEDGVCKKIKMQIDSLNKSGLSIYNYNFILPNRYRNKIFSLFNPYYFTNKVKNDFFNYDFYYIRFPLCSFAFLNLLKYIKKYGKGKILVEIPTFPYEEEIKGCFFDILNEKLFRNKLKKYVNVFTTYSIDKEIYGVPALYFKNGIDCTNIPVVDKKLINQNTIHFLAIAIFSIWHGYDRLINGLYNYYKKNVNKIVYLHLVGDGNQIEYYKNLVNKYNLQKYISFYGFLSGDKLSEIINKSDVGVCSLGNHRTNIFLSSELKSREYLASGLPIISSTKIDVLPDDFKYCLYVPEDESPIDIYSIINFYNKIISEENITQITANIRQFAEENCDINITMKPVVEYLSKP